MGPHHLPIICLLAILPLVSSAGFTTILRRECNGPLEFMPNVPTGLSIESKFFEKTVNIFWDSLRNRAKCQCSQMTNDEFDQMYDPVIAALNIFSPNTRYPSSSSCFPRNPLYFAEIFNVTIPDSCTIDGYKAGNACALKYDVPDLGMSLGVALSRCENSRIPRFSVHCLGENCKHIGKPCINGGDCGPDGKLKCESAFTGSVSNFRAATFEEFVKAKLFDSREGPYGCFQTDNNPTPDTDLWTSLLTTARSYFFFDDVKPTTPNFCIPNNASAINWPNATAFSVDTDHTCNKGLNVSVPLSSWDAKLDDGSSALTDSNDILKNDLPEPTDRISVLKTTCDGQVSIVNNLVRLKLAKNQLPLLNTLIQTAKKLVECRVQGLTNEQFLTQVGLHHFGYFLAHLDASPFAKGWNFGGRVDSILENISKALESKKVNNLPSSCNLQNFAEKGSCGLQYTGLSNLLKLDITLELRVQNCPKDGNTNNLYSIDFECLGSGCKTLSAGQACNFDNDCPSGTVCTNVFPLKPYNTTRCYVRTTTSTTASSTATVANSTASVAAATPTNETATADNTTSTETGVASPTPSLVYPSYSTYDCISKVDGATQSDFFKVILPRKDAPGYCNTSSWSWESDTDHVCNSDTIFAADIGRVLDTVRGPSDPTKNGLKMCTFNGQYLTGQNIQEWVKNSVSANPDGTVSVNYLQALPTSSAFSVSASPWFFGLVIAVAGMLL
ncbi:hypothetical protein BKA69DRAFT_1163002 [Paraphysoderma sedebokerense]|nr:hypothetical protein BKA69DRAFT_1163002 [Paraphysoderma sedebokerense]